ncbi:MAG: molybdenum cofactor guanylyltransferase [Oscillospiraceae bacterium]|nr:molybdenum cofactor guanylyltransferase [Oscillospiraceae bacterium]
MHTSAIILAGGFSSRMGRNKAELVFHGKPLLQHQVDTVRRLGIDDIVVAGYPTPPAGARFVPDLYPHRGPLSGIHAGLLAIRESRAILLPVDAPLIPLSLLRELLLSHRRGATVVAVGEQLEPLIGIYDRFLADDCEALLQGSGSSVLSLLHRVGADHLSFTGDPILLANGNTSEDYARICAYACETPPDP